MWQDYVAKRPMEVETYLGSPLKLSHETGVHLARIEALYAILHNLNIINRQKPKIEHVAPHPPGSPVPPNLAASPLPRMSPQGPMRPMPNGMPTPDGMQPPRLRPRGPSGMGPPPPPGMRRGPPAMNGGGPPNGYGHPHPMNGGPASRQASRRGAMDGGDLEEFSYLVLYDDIPEGSEAGYIPSQQDLALRERELQLRQRELALWDQEMRMIRGLPPGPAPGRGGLPPLRNGCSNGRPSPSNGYPGAGPHMNGRPSPLEGMRQPVPRYPPGYGSAVAPQQVEQHAGVSASIYTSQRTFVV